MSADSAHTDQAGHAVRVVSVQRGEGCVIVFVGSLDGCLSHWAQGRSWLCPGPELCPRALHAGKTLFKAFASVRIWAQSSGSWRPAVLEVTEHLEEQLRGRALPGEEWMLTRAGRGHKSDPVSGCLLGRREEPDLLVRFDHRPAVYRMYHTDQVRWGLCNPLQPRMHLPAIEAAGPTLPMVLEPAEAAGPSAEQLARIRELARGGGAKPRPRPSPATTPATTPSSNGRAH